MSEAYEHTFNDKGICTKCHTIESRAIMNLCPVISKEEVANFTNYDER